MSGGSPIVDPTVLPDAGAMDTPPYAGPSAGPPTPPPPPFGSPRPRQLRRRPDQGHIAGVCAGLAEYFNVDPVIVRIAAVVLAFSGPGVFAYILAWIFVPEASGPSLRPVTTLPADRRDRGAQIFGIVLLAIAVSVLWGDWWSPARQLMFPLGLMALGTWLLLRRDRSDDGPRDGGGGGGASPRAPVAPTPAPWAAPTPTAAIPVDALEGPDLEGTDAATQRLEGDTTEGDTTQLIDEGDTATSPTAVIDPTTPVPTAPEADGGSGGDAPPPAPWAIVPPPGVPEGNGTARRRRRMLGPIVMGALLVWSGVAWLAGVSVENGLAVGLCIVGVGFVLGAFVGGSWGLIVPAFVIGGALIVASVADIPLSGPIGDRSWVPRTVSEVEDRYELSIGEGRLDLTELQLDEGEHLAIDASVGMGHLVIEVPDGVALDISAKVGAGEAVLLGYPDSGVGVSTERSFDGDGDAGSIRLDLQVGLGEIEVRRQSANHRRSTTATTTLG